jgi:hypothetical protein
VDDFHEGKKGARGESPALKIRQNPAGNGGEVVFQANHFPDPPVGTVIRLEERRHIDPLDPGHSVQQGFFLLSTIPGGDDPAADFQHRLFAVPQEKEIKEVGQGLRVQGTGPPPDDQRISDSPLSRAQGNPGQVQDIEDPGVIELILEGKTEDVELSQGAGGFQGTEGESLFPEEVFHVRPGDKNTFTGYLGDFVQKVIENLKTKMGHSHFVHIREGKGKLQLHPVRVLEDRVYLSPDVPRGLGDPEKVFLIHRFILTFDSLGGKCYVFEGREEQGEKAMGRFYVAGRFAAKLERKIIAGEGRRRR